MKKLPRFCRQFVKAWNEFQMASPGDSILLPIDADIVHFALYIGVQSRINKMEKKPSLSIVYLHTNLNVNGDVKNCLDQFSRSRKFTYFSCRINEPKTMEEYKQSLVDIAVRTKCNKIVLTDSLNYVGSMILSKMCNFGMFGYVEMVEKVERIHENEKTDDSNEFDIFYIRPFCYLSDSEIEKFGKVSKFANFRPSVEIVPDESLTRCKKAIQLMQTDVQDDTSNVQMNFLHSQFSIQRKFIGAGDDHDFLDD